MRHYITFLALVAALTATAQDLHKDIEVERDIEPVENTAVKPNILPGVSLPPVKPVSLALNERALTTRVNPLIPFLEPASYADSLYVSPYRGYVGGAISPTPFDAGLSAGYRLVDTDRVRLSIWGQYDTRNYKKTLPWSDYKRYWRDNTVSAGLDFRWAVGSKSTFKTAVDYTFDRYTTIYSHPADNAGPDNLPQDCHFYQTLNLLNLDFNWDSHVDALDYNISLGFNHAGAQHPAAQTVLFFNNRYELSRPVRQNTYTIGATASLPFSEKAYIGLDLGADIITTSAYTMLGQSGDRLAPLQLNPYNGDTRALMTFIPRFILRNLPFSANLGARVQFSANSGRVINITPDVTLGWNPLSMIALEARVTGGVETNTMEHLYGVTPFFNASLGYQFSRVPMDADVKVTFGPYLGAYLQFNAGYSMARRWLMPVTGEPQDVSSTAMFLPTTIDGWRLGAKVGYNWRERIIATVGYTHVPGSSSPEKGYYLWRDRARHQLEASLSIKPIERFTITADYTLRTGRRIIDRYYLVDPVEGTSTVLTRVNHLRNASDLNVGIEYQASDPLNLFVRGENLLGRTALDIALRPNPGFCIFIGAAYRF